MIPPAAPARRRRPRCALWREDIIESASTLNLAVEDSRWPVGELPTANWHTYAGTLAENLSHYDWNTVSSGFSAIRDVNLKGQPAGEEVTPKDPGGYLPVALSEAGAANHVLLECEKKLGDKSNSKSIPAGTTPA
jgi:hypothetical protein